MKIRTVDASHGWRWIAAGIAIFRKDPAQWILLIATLFFVSRVLFVAAATFGVMLWGLAAILTPNFLAGLAHGAQAVETGKPLRLGYLASGFLKSALQLIVIGFVSLAGPLLMMQAMNAVGGDAFAELSAAVASGSATPAGAEAIRAASTRVMMAMAVGVAISLPVTMAVWFSPLLVFFDNEKPLAALLLSLWACVKNVLPLLIYCLSVLIPLMILLPLGLALRQPDLGLWLLAPVLAPSVYAGYKDLFAAEDAEQ